MSGHERGGSQFPGERAAKVIARSGACSRRQAERLIEQGRVAMDGVPLDSPAVNVTSKNVLTIDGRVIERAEKARLWKLHKPSGTLTTSHDPDGRRTVFDRLPDDMPRVVAVGRLDKDTEGLLLLTNDGGLARHLELPGNGWARRYRVLVRGDVNGRKLRSVARGVTIDGFRYGPIKIEAGRQEADGQWLSVTVREGRNHEVRNIMAHLDLKVVRLVRTAYGPFRLGGMPKGSVEEVPADVLRSEVANYFESGRK